MLMRKPVLPRIIGLLCLYCVAFIVLGTLQFTREGSFSRHVGYMQVNGQYRQGEPGVSPPSGEFPVAGELRIFFGGLEFRIDGDDGASLASADPEAVKTAAVPEYMAISGETVSLKFSGGGGLSFSSLSDGDYPELRIEGDFPPEIAHIILPYKPLKTSLVQEDGNGRLLVTVNGQNYSFSRPARGEGEDFLVLENGEGPVSYRAIPDESIFRPEDYALAEALTQREYGNIVRAWRDQNVSRWARLAQGRSDEDLVVAWLSEAAGRGNYRAARAAIPSSFLGGERRGYAASLFLGGMGQAYRGFSAADRERLSRLSRLVDEKNLAGLLGEDHVFEFLAVRGSGDLVDRAAALIPDIDGAELSPELLPGIFEGFSDLKQNRPQGENPFGVLLEPACLVISGSIARVSGVWNSEQGLILVFPEGVAELEFNLRLGKALLIWAEAAGQDDWAALGRSLILSVLSLEDEAGTFPARLSGTGEEESGGRIDSARLYRILQPGEYYPRVISLSPGADGAWIWTVSPSASASREGNVLDIAVSFPAGETHYVMIRGIRSFTRMQLHSMDWRTDPRFESYDSSGWVYYSQDQTLVVKVKHRTPVEHFRLFYGTVAPAPAPPAPAAPLSGPVAPSGPVTGPVLYTVESQAPPAD
jgi:hypothetical protein